MDEPNLELARQREQEYINFIAIYRAYPELMNPPLPVAGDIRLEDCDSGEWVRKLYDTAYQSPYIKRLEGVRLSELFKRLECKLAEPSGGGILVDSVLPESQRSIGRQRRELRFLRRFAGIIKYEGHEFSVPNPAQMRVARKRMANTCRALERRLEILMEDDFLIEGLGQHSLAECRRLYDTMWRMADLFDGVQPSYPFEREKITDSAIAKVLVHWLATCCFRTYGVCDPEIVLQLFSAPWLSKYLSHVPADVVNLIARAAQRNQANYHRRIAEEPWGIEVGVDYWKPPTAL